MTVRIPHGAPLSSASSSVVLKIQCGSKTHILSICFFMTKRRTPRITLSLSSGASDIYKRPAKRATGKWPTQVRVPRSPRSGSRGFRPPRTLQPFLFTVLRANETRVKTVCLLRLEKQTILGMRASALIHTVTYTHLRAHETKVDMVCSLPL